MRLQLAFMITAANKGWKAAGANAVRCRRPFPVVVQTGTEDRNKFGCSWRQGGACRISLGLVRGSADPASDRSPPLTVELRSSMSGVQNITKGQEEERDSETARLSAAATVTSHQQVTFNLEPDEDTDAALKQLIADITTAVRQKLPPAEQRALLGSLRATLEGHQRGTGGGDGGGEGGGDGGAADSEYGGDGGGGVIEPHALEKVLVLASYSPAEVVHRFASIPPAELRMLAEPEKHDFVAAVGFVDVSGFTKLSEKLASEHGRAGAEMLNVYGAPPPPPPTPAPAPNRATSSQLGPALSQPSAPRRVNTINADH